MAAKFKTNLKAEREEQNGSAFYQVSDPETGKSFRLYEVEYLIAKMLDGQTPNEAMPARVQNELQFELSLEDFAKFLRELTDLGFLESTTQREPSVAPATLAPLSVALGESNEEVVDSDIEEIMGEPMEAEPPLEHEQERLVRSGVLHIKQGMVGQARDYFLAARKCAPDDGRVATMLNHLDVVGEDDSTADLEYLWKQALQLYPELCQELGPPGSGTAPIPLEEHGRREGIVVRARKRRGTLVALVLLGVGVGLGLRYAWPMLAAPPPLVETDRVHAQKIQLTFDAEAVRFDSAEVPTSMSLTDYLKSGWIAGLDPNSVTEATVNGLDTASGVAKTDQWSFRVSVARFQGQVVRFIFAAKADSARFGQGASATLSSFRPTTASDLSLIRKVTLQVITARAGDTADKLAQRMAALSRGIDLFYILNNLLPGDPVTAGQKYKIITVG